MQLVNNLAIMAGQLWQVGITDVYINGSFVEDKARPNDIDGYFLCDLHGFNSGRLEQQLRQLDNIWTWRDSSRVFDRNSAKRQLPMWHKYRVELYPELWSASGIPGPNGQPMPFSAAFRQRRATYEPKGIVRLMQ